MNIGIDITSLIYKRGVSRYTSNLVRALLTKKNLSLSLYGSTFRQQKNLIGETKQLLKNRIPGSKHSVLIQNYPPSFLNNLWRIGFNQIDKILPDIEVFHSWDYLQPAIKDIPLVSTIHDLAILKYPETAHPKILKAHQKSWEILKKRNAHIIAVSHATKKDIVNILQIPPYQIYVIQEALPADIKETTGQISEDKHLYLKNRLQLHKPYILFVGSREPRKNLMRLIKAWEPLSKDYQLLVAGEEGWDETSEKSKTFKKILRNPNLRFLGRVSDQELSVLYTEANLFAYPSLYEGFGLPILEAFHHGCPVLTSNTSGMLEVAGNAAELIDPNSVEDIRKGIKKVLKENQADQRKRLQRMIIRLQMFSWDRVASETIKVYQKAITNHHTSPLIK